MGHMTWIGTGASKFVKYVFLKEVFFEDFIEARKLDRRLGKDPMRSIRKIFTVHRILDISGA